MLLIIDSLSRTTCLPGILKDRLVQGEIESKQAGVQCDELTSSPLYAQTLGKRSSDWLHLSELARQSLGQRLRPHR